jgi:DNA polymerase III epsilon subunit-like protein
MNCMSFYEGNQENQSKKVNLNDLIERLNVEKKNERKHNIILSAVAVSAVAVFGIILTL